MHAALFSKLEQVSNLHVATLGSVVSLCALYTLTKPLSQSLWSRFFTQYLVVFPSYVVISNAHLYSLYAKLGIVMKHGQSAGIRVRTTTCTLHGYGFGTDDSGWRHNCFWYCSHQTCFFELPTCSLKVWYHNSSPVSKLVILADGGWSSVKVSQLWMPTWACGVTGG